ncbi:MAG: DUF86 domain-containing protein [Chloroflexota bacterium]|nr:DUF86 domain-containing protein [Chloroflexota bacterium]
MRQTLSLLSDAVDALRVIEEETIGIGFDEFVAERRRRTSVYWHLAVLGESSNGLLRLNPELEPMFPELARAIALRHRIVHGYFAIDDRTIWGVVTEQLPGLADRLDEVRLTLDASRHATGPEDA